MFAETTLLPVCKRTAVFFTVLCFFHTIVVHANHQIDQFVADLCDQLEDGKYEDVLKLLSAYKDITVPAGTVNLYNYISNNKANINYPAYKKRGYFIGSGAIEGGNKTVLQSRLKQAGMRWNPITAQYMLSLKAKEKSGLWYSFVIPLTRNMMG